MILGTLSILGIILLFLRPRPVQQVRAQRVETPDKLFTQVIRAAGPEVLSLWREGARLIPKTGTKCADEIHDAKEVGRSYYHCNPHFWQCYWQGGVRSAPAISVDLFGQTFHLVALPSFPPIPAFSAAPRYYSSFRRREPGFPHQYGITVELSVREIPGLTQSVFLADSCRDTYLPQRIYGYGQVKDKRSEGFVWDNFERYLFLDRFYVTNRQVNEWYLLSGSPKKISKDRKSWPRPALLTRQEQEAYCAFHGKRVLEAKLFDAATMAPAEPKNPLPQKVPRPETPWQRDHARSFLGMARINPDYQLTPLDCQLAQVEGCPEKHFTSDSATWMGIHHALGFYPEALVNFIDPSLNLKASSRFYPAASPWHELGVRTTWSGEQDAKRPVAFRCYEEVEK